MILDACGILGGGLGKHSAASRPVAAGGLPGTPYGHWDMQDLTTVWTDDSRTTNAAVSGTDVIAVVDDRMGNCGNLVQATADHRPLYKNDVTGGGGFNWAFMDGTDDHLEIPTTGGSGDNYSYTVACVILMTNLDATASAWRIGSGAEVDTLLNTDGVWQNWGNGTAHFTTAFEAATLNISWRRGSAAATTSRATWQIGAVTGTPAAGLPDKGDAMFFGSRGTGPSQLLDGAMAELVLYDSYLSDDDIATMEAYFATKYSAVWL